MKQLWAIAVLVMTATLLSLSAWAVPGLINYQGRLTDPGGNELDGNYTMRFELFDALTGGSLIWWEDQNVAVDKGVYNVQLGSVTPLDAPDFFGDQVYLQVRVQNDAMNLEPLTPRQRLTTVAYAFAAQTLDGFASSEFALTGHDHAGEEITSGIVDEARIDPSIARDSEVSWGNLSGIPPDIADGDDGVEFETDPTVDASVKDGVSWGELSGTPSGFSDGVDNDSGGDVTGVFAGQGLTGGGGSGDISLSLDTPLNLDDATPGALISATNSLGDGVAGKTSAANKSGVYGWSDQNGTGVTGRAEGQNNGVLGVTYSLNVEHAGVAGINHSYGSGVYGESAAGPGVWGDGRFGVLGEGFEAGVRASSQKYGVLAFSESGPPFAAVYGHNNATNGHALHGKATGIAGRGVYGEAIAPGTGPWVVTNYGGYFKASGDEGHGVYGEANATGPVINYGGQFRADGDSGVGVQGLAFAKGSVTNYGGQFRADGDLGVGVRGEGGGSGHDFYAGGPGPDYGPFTGAHEVRLADDFPPNTAPGVIVSVTGRATKRLINDGTTSLSSTLPTVALSAKANDKAVFGVLIREVPLPEEHWYEAVEGERFAVINALGEGRVLVSTMGGPIQAGDYITSSPIPGYGRRQGDDLLHSYTVGKAIETVNWGEVTETIEHHGELYKVYLLAVVYTSG